MKSKDVLELLNITRPTLTKYVNDGIIRVVVKENGQYEYNDEDVYKKAGDNIVRSTVIYARVLDKFGENELNEQIKELKKYAFEKNIFIDDFYIDMCSTISLDRIGFNKLITDVMNNKIKKIIVRDYDILDITNIKYLDSLFRKYNCSIEVVNNYVYNKDKEMIVLIKEYIETCLDSISDNRLKRKIQLISMDLENEKENLN